MGHNIPPVYSGGDGVQSFSEATSTCRELAEVVALRQEVRCSAGVLGQCRAALRALEAQIGQCEALLDQMLLEVERLQRRMRPDVRRRDHAEPTALSLRELEVLQLAARGLDNRAIAQRLVVAEGTVKNHLGGIYRKLQVRGRWQAVIAARQAGLLPEESTGEHRSQLVARHGAIP